MCYTTSKLKKERSDLIIIHRGHTGSLKKMLIVEVVVEVVVFETINYCTCSNLSCDPAYNYYRVQYCIVRKLIIILLKLFF